MQETFYSKLCFARSIKFVVEPTSEKVLKLSDSKKFACYLAIILVKDREVVAVNLRLLYNKCKIYIAKNTAWLNEDHEYINKVKQ